VYAFFCSGLIPYSEIDSRLMLPKAFDSKGWYFVSDIILIGSIFSMFPTIMDCLISQTRIIYRVSKDRLLPKNFKQIDHQTQVPTQAVLVTGGCVAFCVLFFHITFLAETINVATIINYVLINSISIYTRIQHKKLCVTMVSMIFGLSIFAGVQKENATDEYVQLATWILICILVFWTCYESHQNVENKRIVEEMQQKEKKEDSPVKGGSPGKTKVIQIPRQD
jgi:APA family basic amino acid/polyamine antiporter